MEPLISVIIPTYNRLISFRRAVQSVLNQTYQNFETIIIDDCSTEDIKGLVQSFNDERIRYYRNEVNLGGAVSRNRGIHFSSGEYVAFLDSDDEWLPEKLQKQLDSIRRNGTGMVFSGMYKISENKSASCHIQPDKTEFSDLLVENYIGTCSVAFVRKDLLDRIQGFDESLPCCQDWDLYLRLSRLCRFSHVPEPLVNYSKSYDESRISNHAKSLLNGYDLVYNKYYDDIGKLSPDQQAAFYNRIGRVFIEAGASFKGLKNIWKAFVVSKDIKYLYIYFKNLIFSFIVQIKILLKGNLARG